MSISDKAVCPECGAALPPNAVVGLCPQCALKGALDLGREEAEAAPASAPWSPRARLGRRFGDFELLELLGRGGMGVVYKAHQSSLNQDVALKMVLDSKQGSAQAVRRFQLEAEVAARLRHPNIVRIYQIGEQDGEQFFTMELVEGESLSRRMAKGLFRVPADAQTKASVHQMQTRIARFMATVARAVDYAHEQGVLHRDIKPGNIILDADNEPHLTDFGLAKLAGNSATAVSDSAGVAGTPAYMAPEQARGERLTRAADIYSLGIVLYELLTGKPPFSGATPLETLRLITDQEPPNPTTTTSGLIDADLATIALKCLEKNPAARYGSAGQLAEDLDRWLRHEPIRARPVGPAVRLQRWVRRNPVGASFIAVLVLGILTTSVLGYRLRIERDTVQARNQTIEQQNLLIRESFSAKVDSFFARQTDAAEIIPAEHIRALLQIPKRRQDYFGKPVRLVLGIAVRDLPMDEVINKGRGLAQLEEQMSSILHTQVLVDMKLFKPGGGKVKALLLGETDFKRMGALPYLAAKAKDPGLMAVARDDDEKMGVFYTRKGSGITNINQIVGTRLAFGDEDATISFQSKVELARAGILGTNLADWKHLRWKRSHQEGSIDLTNRMERTGPPSSHAMAIRAVQLGEFEVGVARREYVQDLTKRELQIIHYFRSSPNFWVVSSKTDPALREAFRQALTGDVPMELTVGPNMIKRVSRIVPVDDSYFDELRRAMANEVRRFEGNRPVQSRFGTPETEEDDQ